MTPNLSQHERTITAPMSTTALVASDHLFTTADHALRAWRTSLYDAIWEAEAAGNTTLAESLRADRDAAIEALRLINHAAFSAASSGPEGDA